MHFAFFTSFGPYLPHATGPYAAVTSLGEGNVLVGANLDTSNPALLLCDNLHQTNHISNGGPTGSCGMGKKVGS